MIYTIGPPIATKSTQPQGQGGWAPFLTFPYDGRYQIPNRADSVPGHSLLSDSSRRRETESERFRVELGYRDMWLSLTASSATFPSSLTTCLLLPSSPLSLCSPSLALASGQNEVCSCFVISSLERKWDENRAGYRPSLHSVVSHARLRNVRLL